MASVFKLLFVLGLLLTVVACDRDEIDLVEMTTDPLPTDTIFCALQLSIEPEGMPVESLTVLVNGGTAPLGYIWSTGATTAATEVDLPGTYSVTVTDNDGCTAEAAYLYSIDGPCNDFALEVLQTAVDSATLELQAVVTGGTPGYAYLWSTNSTAEAIQVPDTPADYGLTVTDAEGCELNEVVSVE